MTTGEGNEARNSALTETLYAAGGVRDLTEQLAGQLQRDMESRNDVCLVGIQRRGDTLARRLSVLLRERLGREIPCGSLDITLYRDDFDSLAPQPVVGRTSLPFEVAGKTIYLVDDVLYTGRTIRAALDELSALGRPSRIILAILIDRGGRELPIAADFVAASVRIQQGSEIQVLFDEDDGEDAVILHHRD